MNRISKRLRSKAMLAVMAGGLMLQFGGCELGTINAASAVELSTRDVLMGLVRGWVLDPIEAFVNDRVDALFDTIEGE